LAVVLFFGVVVWWISIRPSHDRNWRPEVVQTRTSSLGAARPLPPSADVGPGGQSVGQAAQFCFS